MVCVIVQSALEFGGSLVLCVHFVMYFDSIVVIDGQIAIVDFEIDCNQQWVN
jgi:hypothetical protein